MSKKCPLNGLQNCYSEKCQLWENGDCGLKCRDNSLFLKLEEKIKRLEERIKRGLK